MGSPATPAPSTGLGGIHFGFGATPEAASAGLASVTQALRAAANQQQQLQTQQAQQARQEEIEYWQAIKDGAQDYSPQIMQANTQPVNNQPPAYDAQGNRVPPAPAGTSPLGPDDPNHPRLIQRVPNPAAATVDPARIRTFPISGRQVYYPTDKEKAAAKKPVLDDTNSVQLGKELADFANKAGFTNVHEGSRLPTAQGLTLSERLAAANASEAKGQQQTVSDRLKIAQQGGTPAPARNYSPADWAPPDPHVQVTSGGQTFNLPTPEEQAAQAGAKRAPKTPTYHYSGDDNGTVHIFRDGEEIKAVKNAGPKRKDPDATPAPKPPSAAQLREVSQKKGDGLAKAESDFQKDLEVAVSPEDRKAATQKLLGAKQAVQNEYEQSLAALTGHDVPHFDFGAQRAAPPIGQTERPVPKETLPQPGAAPQKAAPKFSEAQVRARAKSAGKDPDAVVKAARAAGMIE